MSGLLLDCEWEDLSMRHVLLVALVLVMACEANRRREEAVHAHYDREEVVASSGPQYAAPSRRLLSQHSGCVRDAGIAHGPATEPVPFDSPRQQFLENCMSAHGWRSVPGGWVRSGGGPIEVLDDPWKRP
jgi:hypothetical protein